MQLVRIFADGYRTGILAKEGTRWAHVVIMGCPIDVQRFPIDDPDAWHYLDGDPAKAARRFLASPLGITERARALLVDGLARVSPETTEPRS